MEAIKKYGFTDPVHVSRLDHTLIEGYARVEASKQLHLQTVRAIELDLDPEEYYIAMILGNRLSEMASWDFMSLMSIYEEQLKVKDVPPPELGFSLEEFDNLKQWQSDQGGAVGFDLSDYVERSSPSAAPPLPEGLRDKAGENKIVEITLSISKERWELVRVELEADLVSIADKFQGLHYSPPKVKRLLV